MKKIRIFVILSILIFLLLLCGTVIAQGNTVSIFGYIEDDSGNLKENVKIRIEGQVQSYEAITDSNGFYHIEGVDSGDYKIKYDYSELEEDYKIKKTKLCKFEKYIDKLEIAFIYEETMEECIENYIIQVKSITKEERNYTKNF